MVQLDLCNYRGEKPTRTAYVYDSSSHREITNQSASKSAAKGTGSFLVKPKKEPTMVPAKSIVEPIITEKGDYWELQERVKRKDAVVKMQRTRGENIFDRRLNPIAKAFVTSDRPRIDTPCMNRIMNKRTNIPPDGIMDRILAGKVPGGKITSTGFEPKYADDSSNSSKKENGKDDLWRIVDYDVNRWEAHPKYGNRIMGAVFSTAPGHEGFSQGASPISAGARSIVTIDITPPRVKGMVKFGSQPKE